jgi:hypothetical protein
MSLGVKGSNPSDENNFFQRNFMYCHELWPLCESHGPAYSVLPSAPVNLIDYSILSSVKIPHPDRLVYFRPINPHINLSTWAKLHAHKRTPMRPHVPHFISLNVLISSWKNYAGNTAASKTYYNFTSLAIHRISESLYDLFVKWKVNVINGIY